MKKNSLTTAVIAGIAGVAGFAGLANAVHLNPDGIGQVMLYPYYTNNNGQQTLLSVTNTDQIAKAAKVRFLEGYNSRDVLDFNLFLSPYDVWTATIFALHYRPVILPFEQVQPATAIFAADMQRIPFAQPAESDWVTTFPTKTFHVFPVG